MATSTMNTESQKPEYLDMGELISILKTMYIISPEAKCNLGAYREGKEPPFSFVTFPTDSAFRQDTRCHTNIDEMWNCYVLQFHETYSARPVKEVLDVLEVAYAKKHIKNPLVVTGWKGSEKYILRDVKVEVTASIGSFKVGNGDENSALTSLFADAKDTSKHLYYTFGSSYAVWRETALSPWKKVSEAIKTISKLPVQSKTSTPEQYYSLLSIFDVDTKELQLNLYIIDGVWYTYNAIFENVPSIVDTYPYATNHIRKSFDRLFTNFHGIHTLICSLEEFKEVFDNRFEKLANKLEAAKATKQ